MLNNNIETVNRCIPSQHLDGHGNGDALDEWIHTRKGKVEPRNTTDYTFPISCSNIVDIDNVCPVILKK